VVQKADLLQSEHLSQHDNQEISSTGDVTKVASVRTLTSDVEAPHILDPPRANKTIEEETVIRPVSTKEELYKIVSQVGEGTFGKVYKAQNIVTHSFVALKRIRMEGERDGFPVTAMREIKLLQSLRHPNVITLHEMMVSKGL
jgi:CTD kinase subunit alpha